MIDINKLRQLAQGANEHSDDRAEILAEFYAATQSDTIIELIDRLEAAEKERDWHAERCEDAMDECARLRSKIEAIERQEPVAWLHEGRRNSHVVTSGVKRVWGKTHSGLMSAYSIPLILALDAQG